MRTPTPRGVIAAAAVLITLIAGVLQAGSAQARAWLGVYSQEVTDELRDGLDLRGAEGVLVARVVPGSPAERAGLRQGDVIVTFASRSVASPERLSELVGDAQSGESVSLVVVRAGARKTLSARLDERPDGDAPEAPEGPEAPDAPEAPRSLHIEGLQGLEGLRGLEELQGIGPGGKRIQIQMTGRGRLGVRVESLNADLAVALGAPNTKGVLVLEVLGGTPAEKAGLKAGDILTSVDGTSVYDQNDLIKSLADQEGAVSLSVTRKGIRRTVQATLQQTQGATRMRSGSDQMGLGRTGDRRVIRLRGYESTDREGLRQELDDLREQVRELRQRLEESRR